MGGDITGSGRLPTPREVEAEVRALLPKEDLGLGMTVSVEWAPPVEGGYYVRLHLGDESELIGGQALSDALEDWDSRGIGFLRVLVEDAARKLAQKVSAQESGDEP